MHVRGIEPSPIRVSLYKGSRPDGWKSRVPTFGGVDLGEPYAHVRIELRAAGNNVEKILHVAPGGDVRAIRLAVDGIDRLAVGDRGELVLKTSRGDASMSAPAAYQMIDGKRRPVEVAYALADAHHYGFRLGAHDPRREVIIDPLLASTYLGGHNPDPPGNYDDDIIYSMIAVGGDVYVGGATQSPDFPIHLGYDDTLANSYPDGFLTRMSGDLSTVIASTYIGTDGFDQVRGIAVDGDGSIIAVGQAGYGFPVTDGAYTWSGGTPVGGGFVSRFSADLSMLETSAVVVPQDFPTTVTLGNGGVYFGGSTNDPAFPITPGAYLSTCCPPDGFGIRPYNGFAGHLSEDFTTLDALTYLGGYIASSMVVDSDGGLVVTDGFDYGITGYIARFDPGLTTRSAYLSYYPGSTSGSSRTYFNDVIAGDGFVITGGQTYMNDLPATVGAFDTTCGTDGLCDPVGPFDVPHADGFVAIYSNDLSTTIALTYLGGSTDESVRALARLPNGDIAAVGETTSVDLPTGGDGADTTCGSDGNCDPTGMYDDPTPDGFVVRLSSDLSGLGYGTYLGGAGEDRPLAVTADAMGRVYAAGYTRSTDFPTTPGAFDTTYNGGTSDAFISSFDTGEGTIDFDTVFVNGFDGI